MPTVVPRWTTVMRTTDADADVADVNHPAAHTLLGFYQTIARVLDPRVPGPDMHAAVEEVSRAALAAATAAAAFEEEVASAAAAVRLIATTAARDLALETDAKAVEVALDARRSRRS